MVKMTKNQMKKRLIESAIKINKVAFMFKGPMGSYSALSARDRKELASLAERTMKIAEKLN